MDGDDVKGKRTAELVEESKSSDEILSYSLGDDLFEELNSLTVPTSYPHDILQLPQDQEIPIESEDFAIAERSYRQHQINVDLACVAEAASSDGYAWTKHGIANFTDGTTKFHYACYTASCLARKHIEVAPDGVKTTITYVKAHNHLPPGQRAAGPSHSAPGHAAGSPHLAPGQHAAGLSHSAPGRRTAGSPNSAPGPHASGPPHSAPDLR